MQPLNPLRRRRISRDEGAQRRTRTWNYGKWSCINHKLPAVVLLCLAFAAITALQLTRYDLHREISLREAEAKEILVTLEARKMTHTSAFSYRHNTDIDTRPQHIFGPLNMYNKIEEFDNLSEIPHIIHQTNKNSEVSVIYKEYMLSMRKMNPHWQYWFWTDEDIDKFISTRYPNFKPIFSKYKFPIQRSDTFRYFLMYEYGGFYADCDAEAVQPLDAKVAEGDCFLCLQADIHALVQYGMPRLIDNGIMGCRSRHPFFKFLIEDLTRDRRNERDDVLNSTGPLMVDEVYNRYAQISDRPPALMESELFEPLADPRLGEAVVKGCKKMMVNKPPKIDSIAKVKEMCAPYKSGNVDLWPRETKNSITIHHWSHSWISGFETDKFGMNNEKRTFNITDLKL